MMQHLNAKALDCVSIEKMCIYEILHYIVLLCSQSCQVIVLEILIQLYPLVCETY